MAEKRIRHSVIFSLKYGAEAPETEQFLRDGKAILSSIPVVEGFEVLRQVSPKNGYQFGFSMEFAGKAAYEAYNTHPLHVDFVRNRWEKEVESFLEIDYEPYL